MGVLICLICVCCRAPPWRTSAPSWGTSLWRRIWPRSERCSSFATCPTPTVTLWKLPWWMLHTNTYTRSRDTIGMMIKPHLSVSVSVSPSRWFVLGALYKANEEKLAPLKVWRKAEKGNLKQFWTSASFQSGVNCSWPHCLIKLLLGAAPSSFVQSRPRLQFFRGCNRSF